MAEASMTSQSTTSSSLPGGSAAAANVSVYVRWRPLTPEEAGHEEITRTTHNEGRMQRVVFQGQRCMAGTNVPAKTLVKEAAAGAKPSTAMTKNMARLAKKLRKREAKANRFHGLLHGVFESEDNNQTVYENSVKQCVAHVLNGGVGAVFTYGQTGSGKTHTVLGYGEEQGLAYQAMEQMQEAIQKMNRDDAWVNVSFTEMYKRSVYDLLNKRSAAAARENADGDVVFRKYTNNPTAEDESVGFEVRKYQCRTVADASDAIQLGIQHRVVGNSNVHSQSSRSHAFLEYEITTEKLESLKGLRANLEGELNEIAAIDDFQKRLEEEPETLPVKVRFLSQVKSSSRRKYTFDLSQKRNQCMLEWMTPEQLAPKPVKGKDPVHKWYSWLIKQVEAQLDAVKTEEGAWCQGKMVLVDLAGSEHGADKRNQSQSAEEWQEAKQINVSLAALNDVIYAQHSGKKRVPYRASVLTRILRKYLSDKRCQTVMIGNLSPSLIHSAKSMKTLRYCCMVAKAGTAAREE